MTDAFRCEAGDWVEVERVLLESVERAAGLPEDTAAQPLRAWVKGFARESGLIGDAIEVETMTGRVVRGHLSAVSPGYTHTFGTPPAEIVGVGRDLRARLAAYRASGGQSAAVQYGTAQPPTGAAASSVPGSPEAGE